MHTRIVAAVARTVERADRGERVNVRALAAELGVSAKTFYKWAARYRQEGLVGLEERSRRPRRSPARISPMVEDAIVEWRKRLGDAGLDCGAATIHWHLGREGTVRPPSEATIWRVLVRRGLVVPEPRKRPKASFCRFEASTPNEWWQIDACDWVLADGSVVEIINLIDDHSRLCVTSRAVKTTTSPLAWAAFCQGVDRYGWPAGCLSDNGLAFSGRFRNVEVFFETQLRTAGVRPITSRPRHPQTCGKVERFQQTLKKWLRPRRQQARTLAELQTLLDEFRDYYNRHRPHRGIGRVTPWERWSATPRATATPGTIPSRPRQGTVTVDGDGKVSVERWLISVGRKHAKQRAHVLVDGDHVAVIVNNRLVRELDLDRTSTRRYQTGR